MPASWGCWPPEVLVSGLAKPKLVHSWEENYFGNYLKINVASGNCVLCVEGSLSNFAFFSKPGHNLSSRYAEGGCTPHVLLE
jgi:hypothetical protein